MIAAGIDNAKRIALRSKITRNGVHLRIGRFKIERNHAAGRSRHLVKQTAGLAKVHVFNLLGNYSTQLKVHNPAIVKAVENRRNQDFKRRRGRQAAAAKHRAGNRRTEAANLIAHILHDAGSTANQRQRGAKVLLADLQTGQIHSNRRETFAVYNDHIVIGLFNTRNGIQIDSARKAAAVVVIGVIAADFGTARRREEAQFAMFLTKALLKALHKLAITRLLKFKLLFARAIQRCNAGSKTLRILIRSPLTVHRKSLH